ncbi:MAG: TolC family protein [Pseudoflavonifractor sp.]|nr:TolC family protein [Pseudoflavonifractor sp.]
MRTIGLMITVAGLSTMSISARDYGKLLQEVASNNIEVSSAVSMMASEAESLRSENNLPDPEIGFDYLWGRGDAGNKYAVSVSQSFDWPGLYRARGNAVRSDISAMTMLAQSRYLDKMMEVERLFIDIIGARKRLHLYDESMALLDSLMAKYRKGAANGEFTRLDVSKIRLAQLSVARQRDAIGVELDVLEQSLLAANGGKSCQHILQDLDSYDEVQLRPESEYMSLVERYDPQVASASLLDRSHSERLKVAKMSYLPSFSVGYSHENESGEIYNGVTLSVTLPFFSNRHKVKAARLALQSTQADISGLVIDKMAAMRADYALALSLSRKLNDYNEVFGNDNYPTLLQKSLDGGEMSLLDYIQEMRYYLDEMSAMLAIRYELQVVMARLNRYSLLEYIPQYAL